METWERGSTSSPLRDTHIYHPGRVASAQVVQHRGLVEVCQHGHVFNHVKLRRIHLLDVTVLHRPSLKRWDTRCGYSVEEEVSDSLGFCSLLHINRDDHWPSRLWFQQWLCPRCAPWSRSQCTPPFHRGSRPASSLTGQQRGNRNKTLLNTNVGRDNSRKKKKQLKKKKETKSSQQKSRTEISL